MIDFLLLLGKLNLAFGGAIALVWLLRRPIRTQFGAPIAYGLWLLVPIAGLACLLPPRVAAPLPVHVAAVQVATTPVMHLAPRVTELPAAQSAPTRSVPSPSMRPMIAAPATDFALPDYATLLFAAWVLGVAVMTLYLARLQARFHAAARLGEAGPAVAGFFRPRIVIPGGFAEQFNAAEQAAILAHERAHLARQDARINALAALLRCLCWFNPLMHLGAGWLRIDQELACDAAAMRGQVSRRDYANALLKSQMTLTPLPLGCDWPGSEHPLTERIALLKRRPPGPSRRMAGAGLVIFAAVFAGLSAWAAQPAVPGKAVAAPHNQIALASAPKSSPVPEQESQSPVPAAAPIPSDNPAPAAKSALVIKPVAVTPRVQSVEANQPEAAENSDVQMALNTAEAPAIGATAPAAAVTTVQAATPVPSAVPVQVAAAAQVPADSGTADARAPKTAAAMRCWLGVGQKGCETEFLQVPHVLQVPRAIPDCSGPYPAERGFPLACPRGILETIEYLGSNGSGNDVYDVKYVNGEQTFVISSPGPDGKIHRVRSWDRNPSGVVPGSEVAITRPTHPMLIFSGNGRADTGTLSNAAIRPEIAHHLQLAQQFAEHGVFQGVQTQLKEAGSYDNETDDEKAKVAQAKTRLLGNRSGADNNPFFQDWMNGPQQSLGTMGLPPGDAIQCPNCGINTPKAN